ncbi:chitinase [Paeniglutamicibacter sp. R2-26]|uniref:chitinase n=1 Tax=Paeniglutamicibacter sp. R2-26 TaxID=3144417 RepID=UPI003EE7A082
MSRTDGRRLSWGRLLFLVAVVGAAVWAGLHYWTSNRDAARAAESGHWFGAYVDTTSTPFYPIAEDVGKRERVVLGFAVADPKEACSPSWGGYYSMDAANETFDLDRQVARVREQGGEVVISTGGLLNDELATACTDIGKVVSGYESLLERYESTTLDLDVEGDDLEDSDSGLRRAAAVAEMQKRAAGEGRNIEVWVTLPVDTRGLTASGLGEVRRLLEGGVDLAGINLMTMNFGETREANQSMAAASEQAATSAHRQLLELYKSLNKATGEQTMWSKIGLTPMIGQNDLSGEIFTLEDAVSLNTFAKENGLGRISMWSANRDADCGPNMPESERVSNNCSGTKQAKGEFGKLLSLGLGSGSSTEDARPSAVPVPEETAIVDDPAKSPYPVWNVDAAYPKSERVVWRGNVFEAKWWTQGDVPDQPVADAGTTPWLLIGPVLPGDKPEPIPTAPSGLYPEWSAETVYEKSDRIIYGERVFESKWWNQGESPEAALQGAVNSPWLRLSNSQLQDAIDGAATKSP